MITVSNVSLSFSDRKLYDDVNLKFTPGNCYGLIGANGAGKSTFLKILSGEITPSTGKISLDPNERMTMLQQNHYAFEEYTVLETVIMGYKELYAVMEAKDAIYAKADFSDEDGIKVAELESDFAEMNGWEAESEASTLLQGLGFGEDMQNKKMSELTESQKVKILLAQALFGNPDVLLLDEPTNGLDIKSINWLEDFLINFSNTVIVVSHDRHFLNNVCTHMCDVDFGKIKLFIGNYDFWMESSALASKLANDSNDKKEAKIKELQDFVARFSANASKSKQATSRKKMLEKITLDDIQPSSRRYPFINFEIDREIGNDLLSVSGVSKTIDGVKVLDNISFSLGKDDKTAFTSETDIAVTTLIRILSGELEPDTGTVQWGVTTSQAYLAKDNNDQFTDEHLTIIDWLRQFASKAESDNTFLRGFLGRMLFSGEEVDKEVGVLSGGEKVRCMLSKMMLTRNNVLLLDDPTNHLDLESITSLNEGLSNYKSALLFGSHDREFIQTIANRIIEVTPNGLVDRADTTYDEFLENKDVQDQIAGLYKQA